MREERGGEERRGEKERRGEEKRGEGASKRYTSIVSVQEPRNVPSRPHTVTHSGKARTNGVGVGVGVGP